MMVRLDHVHLTPTRSLARRSIALIVAVLSIAVSERNGHAEPSELTLRPEIGIGIGIWGLSLQAGLGLRFAESAYVTARVGGSGIFHTNEQSRALVGDLHTAVLLGSDIVRNIEVGVGVEAALLLNSNGLISSNWFTVGAATGPLFRAAYVIRRTEGFCVGVEVPVYFTHPLSADGPSTGPYVIPSPRVLVGASW